MELLHRTFYDEAGKIISVTYGDGNEPYLDEHYKSIDGNYPMDLYYIKEGKPVAKKPMELVVDTIGLIITGIPKGTTVVVNGPEYTVDDGEIEIARPLGLPVLLVFTHVAYLEQRITL